MGRAWSSGAARVGLGYVLVSSCPVECLSLCRAWAVWQDSKLDYLDVCYVCVCARVPALAHSSTPTLAHALHVWASPPPWKSPFPLHPG